MANEYKAYEELAKLEKQMRCNAQATAGYNQQKAIHVPENVFFEPPIKVCSELVFPNL